VKYVAELRVLGTEKYLDGLVGSRLSVYGSPRRLQTKLAQLLDPSAKKLQVEPGSDFPRAELCGRRWVECTTSNLLWQRRHTHLKLALGFTSKSPPPSSLRAHTPPPHHSHTVRPVPPCQCWGHAQILGLENGAQRHVSGAIR